MFHKIKDAYDILGDEKLRAEYDEHFRAKKEFEQRVFVQNTHRARYANDLIEREEENLKKKMQKDQDRQEKILERQKEIERLKKEQEDHEVKKKLEREKGNTAYIFFIAL
jgi:DnaJ-class molecular chaperone